MRVWLAAVAVLFVLVELLDWLKGFILPFPVYVLGGAFLAITSNYDKGLSSLLSPPPSTEKTISQTAVLVEPTEVELLEDAHPG